MIVEFFGNPMNLWLLGTAILFTLVGRYMGYKATVEDAVETTIDSLIEQGYIKTEGYGAKMEIIKWKDWCCNDQTSR